MPETGKVNVVEARTIFERPVGLFDPSGRVALIFGGASGLLVSEASDFVTDTFPTVDGGWLAG